MVLKRVVCLLSVLSSLSLTALASAQEPVDFIPTELVDMTVIDILGRTAGPPSMMVHVRQRAIFPNDLELGRSFLGEIESSANEEIFR